MYAYVYYLLALYGQDIPRSIFSQASKLLRIVCGLKIVLMSKLGKQKHLLFLKIRAEEWEKLACFWSINKNDSSYLCEALPVVRHTSFLHANAPHPSQNLNQAIVRRLHTKGWVWEVRPSAYWLESGRVLVLEMKFSWEVRLDFCVQTVIQGWSENQKLKVHREPRVFTLGNLKSETSWWA